MAKPGLGLYYCQL